MKKNLFTAQLLLAASLFIAQTGRVGINTESPKTSLDVNGRSDSNGVSLTNDITGLQAPRLTRLELTNKGNTLYTQDQRGALIYITDISGGDTLSQRVNITSVGYYYFNGTEWIKISPDINIYKDDGTLTSNRTMTMDGKTLTFLGNNQRTIINSGSGIRQESLASSSTGLSNILIVSPDRNSNNVETRLSLQAFPESNTQVFAGLDAISLDIGSNATTNSVPIRFITSAGSSALGTEKARITGDGKMGIGAISPSNKFHVVDTSDPVRFEGVQNTNATNVSSLVIDPSGVVKTSFLQRIKFGGYITTNFSMSQPSTGNSIAKVIIDNEQIDLENEYDTSTGLFTPLETGVYIWEFATSYFGTNAVDNDFGVSAERAVIGVASNSTNLWVARANIENSTDTRYFLAKGIVTLTAGTSYYFGLAAPVNKSMTLVASPTGATGSGIGTYFSFTRLK